MKVIIYNMYVCKPWKVERLLEEQADFYIVPELGNENNVSLPEGWAMRWFGDESFCDWKGLGVIWNTKHKCVVPDWWNPAHKFILPVIMDDEYLMLAMWPTVRKEYEVHSYPVIAWNALSEYEPYLGQFKTVIAGDFNCYVGQNGERKKDANIRSIYGWLAERGFVSAYHASTHEALDEESVTTLYFSKNQARNFFIDYTFTNIAYKKFQLIDWGRDFSDHTGQLLEI